MSANIFVVLGGGVLAFLAFFLENARSSSPVVDLTLFRARNFCYANAATLIYAIAFTTMFFGTVLFQIHVWGYSIARAGAGSTPGPVTVVPVAVAAGRFAARRGHRDLPVSGDLIFAAGGALLAFGLPATPTYLTRFLPTAIITDIGVDLMMPSLTGAAVHGLPDDRFALGSALNQAFRQIAAALGVALTLALLATAPGPRGFTHAFVLVMIGGLATALLAVPIDTRPRVQAAGPRADNVDLV